MLFNGGLLASQIKSENDHASTFSRYKEQKSVLMMTQGFNQQKPLWESLRGQMSQFIQQNNYKRKNRQREGEGTFRLKKTK